MAVKFDSKQAICNVTQIRQQQHIKFVHISQYAAIIKLNKQSTKCKVSHITNLCRDKCLWVWTTTDYQPQSWHMSVDTNWRQTAIISRGRRQHMHL